MFGIEFKEVVRERCALREARFCLTRGALGRREREGEERELAAD